MSAFLSKYGVARHIYIPIVKRAVVDHAVSADWTPSAGDVKISKDGGAAANVTNLPTAIAMGNSTIWDFSITATEMQAAQVMVTVADSATKAVEDTAFIIETYGNASGQHAVDLADSVRAGLTGLANAVPGAAGGLLIAGTNTATTFAGVAASGATPATAGLTVTGGAASTTGGGVAGTGLVVTGGAGAASTNGAASGATFTGGGTNTVATIADGIKATGTSTGHGLDAQSGAGATGNGINAVSNATNGSGATLTKAGSGNDLNATSTPLVLAKTTNITGLNDIAATAVVSSGAITTSGGAVTTVTTATNVTTVNGLAANVITATSINADAITAAKVADGTIDAATFAAGAINAAAIAADAITDAKVAADVTIASVTGAVGSVTGAVGSVTGAVGSVTSAVTLTAAYDLAKTAAQAGDAMTLTAAYNAAKTAAQAGDAMALTGGERTTLAGVINTTAIVESYRANGAAPTPAQFMAEVLAHLGESSISGTTKTTHKLDHSTTAQTFTLDSGTAPTSITRAT